MSLPSLQTRWRSSCETRARPFSTRLESCSRRDARRRADTDGSRYQHQPCSVRRRITGWKSVSLAFQILTNIFHFTDTNFLFIKWFLLPIKTHFQHKNNLELNIAHCKKGKIFQGEMPHRTCHGHVARVALNFPIPPPLVVRSLICSRADGKMTPGVWRCGGIRVRPSTPLQ